MGLSRLASDLRSPSEKALGLEPGELYGADEDMDQAQGFINLLGWNVELSSNESTSQWTAWIKGVGNIAYGYSRDEVRRNARKFLMDSSFQVSQYPAIVREVHRSSGSVWTVFVKTKGDVVSTSDNVKSRKDALLLATRRLDNL